MPTEQNPSSSRRQHFNRGGRRPERRSGGGERRPQPQSAEPPRPDQVDVENVMREIRARIAQRHGIDLSQPQIQELAARRLEAILDPRTVKPGLLEQLRKSAGDVIEHGKEITPAYAFEDSTLYESHNGLLRFIRKLLNPLLKLFFNPNPLIQALNTQAKLNAELAKREDERDRRQAEWNALHYTLLQRVVLELSRTSIDAQNLAARVEALGTRVDYADRRVRTLEGAPPPVIAPRFTDPAPHAAGHTSAAAAPPAPAPNRAAVGTEGGSPAADGSPDGTRRRRRRRRGRRSGAPGDASPTDGGARGGADASDALDGDDEGDTREYRELPPPPETLRALPAGTEPEPRAAESAADGATGAPVRAVPPSPVAEQAERGRDGADTAATPPEGPFTPSATSLEPTDR